MTATSTLIHLTYSGLEIKTLLSFLIVSSYKGKSLTIKVLAYKKFLAMTADGLQKIWETSCSSRKLWLLENGEKPNLLKVVNGRYVACLPKSPVYYELDCKKCNGRYAFLVSIHISQAGRRLRIVEWCFGMKTIKLIPSTDPRQDRDNPRIKILIATDCYWLCHCTTEMCHYMWSHWFLSCVRAMLSWRFSGNYNCEKGAGLCGKFNPAQFVGTSFESTHVPCSSTTLTLT